MYTRNGRLVCFISYPFLGCILNDLLALSHGPFLLTELRCFPPAYVSLVFAHELPIVANQAINILNT